LVTKRENLEKVVSIAMENYPVFSVLPFKPLNSGVVITGSEVYYERIQDRFEPIMTQKLESLGAELLGFAKCPDDLDMILAAIRDFISKGGSLYS
jgi:molybdopterin biosynthesis enzyme